MKDDIRLNGSGYKDETAFQAISHVTKQEMRKRKRSRKRRKKRRVKNTLPEN